jgi:hypothetical protein
MLSPDQIRSLTQQVLRSPGQLIALSGSSAATATTIKSEDNRAAYVRSLGTKEAAPLALIPGYVSNAKQYRVTVSRDQISGESNLSYWISSDGGTTKEQAKLLKIEPRNQDAYYWLFLQVM